MAQNISIPKGKNGGMSSKDKIKEKKSKPTKVITEPSSSMPSIQDSWWHCQGDSNPE